MMMDFSRLPPPEVSEARSNSGNASPPMPKPPILRKLRRLTPSQNRPEEFP
jgi:hypothetical protein